MEIEDKEEDWLPPPPKVSVDAKDMCGEDSTLKKLRYSNLVTCIYCLINSLLFQHGNLRACLVGSLGNEFYKQGIQRK